MVYYYFVCHRKLWYFLHEIQMENENEDVKIGKEIDENSYDEKDKHITINNEISIDFKDSGTIHEVKKSKSIEEASIWQIKYYLYYLEKYGVDGLNAELNYPLLHQTKEISLIEDDKVKLEKVIEEIEYLKNTEYIPDKLNKIRICKKCAYYDFCNI